jgi:hypothetical protein
MSSINYIAPNYIESGYFETQNPTVISMRQYDNSPIFQQILLNFANYLDSRFLNDNIYNECVDLDSCTGVWLDVWGRKVGIDRYMQVPSAAADYFGFNNPAGNWKPFNEGVFFNGSTSSLSSSNTVAYAMSDEAYRLMILAKAFANIADCTAKTLNALLQIMFKGRGSCFVRDLQSMEIQYVFLFALEPWEISVLVNNILPSPAGVKSSIVYS